MRTCEQCGTKMPSWKPRRRPKDPNDNRLLCNGCNPDGAGPGEGRPVGHHGALASTSAAAVSALLRRSGFNPLGSGSSRSREGVRVTQSYTGVTVIADLDSDDEAERMSLDVESALREAGLTVERTAPNMVRVAGQATAGVIELRCSACGASFSRLGDQDHACPSCGNAENVHLTFEDEDRTKDYVFAARVASVRDPIRALAMQYIAHDSGDGETIYHCPFCGGGGVTGRSDGTVECSFCQNAFTVQIQPVHPGAPQTIDGQPVEWPGQPEGTFQPEREAEPGAETGAIEGAPAETEEPALAPGGGPPEERKNKVPPQFANASFITQAGHLVDVDAYQRHLAIRFADDPQAVLPEVRAAVATQE